MTPGAYLRQRREAAGLSLDDVALRTETVPPVCARSRVEFLASIEADLVTLTSADAFRLRTIYNFDWPALNRCVVDHDPRDAAAWPAPLQPPRLVLRLATEGVA